MNSAEFNELKRQVTNLTTFLKVTNKNITDINKKIEELKAIASTPKTSSEISSQVQEATQRTLFAALNEVEAKIDAQKEHRK